MSNATRLRSFTAVIGALAVVLGGCAAPGEPVEPAPVETVQRPKPANATVARDVSAPGKGSECNALASLPPKGGIPSGSTMAEIKERGYLVAGVDQNTYLFGFRNPTTGKLEGFDIAVAKMVAEAIFGDPSKIRFRAMTSAERIPSLRSGAVDIVVRTMTINCERKEQVGFSAVYYVAGQRVLVEKSAQATGLADLGGKNVCATHGSTSLKRIGAAESDPIPVAVDNWSDCLVMLQQSQVAAVSTDDTILAGMKAQDPTTKIVGERISEEPYGIGIPQENSDMVRYVNEVLENAIESGAWQAAYDQWLQGKLGPAEPPARSYQ